MRAAGLSRADELCDGREPRAHRIAQQRPDGVWPVEHLPQDQPRPVGVVREEPPHRTEDRLEASEARRRREDQPGECLLPVREKPFEHGIADVLLGGEIMQYGGFGDPDCVGDVLQRGAIEAPLGEEPCGLTHHREPHLSPPRALVRSCHPN